MSGQAPPEPAEGAGYRIDELARLADTTVRNVRVYQDRGLLPPPRRAGRVGIYSDTHLARLRLIGQLLGRGFTFVQIAELISAWEQGRDLGDLLGLEEAIASPWSDELAGYATADELAERFGAQLTPALLDRAVSLRLVVPEGDRFRVPSPRLLHAGTELVAAGIPLDAVLDLSENLARDLAESARRLVETVAEHLAPDDGAGGLAPGVDVAEVAAVIRRLRPLAALAVDAHLSQAMAVQAEAILGRRLAAMAERSAGHSAGHPVEHAAGHADGGRPVAGAS